MFIDTHTHLFSDKFEGQNEEVVERAIRAGVDKMLLPNIDLDSIGPMNDLCRRFPDNCFAMMGLHPGSVDENYQEKLIVIKQELFRENSEYIALGEIGIDLYWDKTFLSQQQDAFRQQVRWAKELELPIVIHAREAFDEIFEILDLENDENLSGVFHCFTGTVEQGKKALSYGNFKLGIGGVVTYKKSGLDEVLRSFSLSDLILETDSPYLAPVPFRGKNNESSYLIHIAEKIADIYSVKLQEVAELTSANALQLFTRVR